MVLNHPLLWAQTLYQLQDNVMFTNNELQVEITKDHTRASNLCKGFAMLNRRVNFTELFMQSAIGFGGFFQCLSDSSAASSETEIMRIAIDASTQNNLRRITKSLMNW